MTDLNLHIGDTVEYRGAFGAGPVRQATILDFDEKNGKRLVDLDNGHWAYLNQIIRVVREA